MSAVIRQLARRHEVHLVAVALEDPDPADLKALEELCASVRIVRQSQANWRRALRVIRSLVLRRPFILSKHMSAALVRTVREVAETVRPDAALAELHYVADAVMDLDVPAVVDLYNIDFLLYDRFARTGRFSGRKIHGYLQRPLIRRYEESLPHRVAACVTVSESDRELLASLSHASNISVVPNGVDVDYFNPGIPPGVAFDLLLVGSMDYYPNVDGSRFLVEEVMPHVWSNRPDATVGLVGRAPVASVRALGNDPRVTVTGAVPDVRPYFAAGRVALVPLRIGGGSRLKAVEAAAMARPIVGTSVGLEGSGLVHERTALIADEPAALAAAILRVLDDSDLAQSLGAAARDYVVAELSWERCILRLDRVLEAATAS